MSHPKHLEEEMWEGLALLEEAHSRNPFLEGTEITIGRKVTGRPSWNKPGWTVKNGKIVRIDGAD